MELVAPRRRGGRHLTPDEQRFMAQQSVQSCLSVREFAQRNRVGYSSLNRWRKEYLGDTPSKAPAPFVAVQISDKLVPPAPQPLAVQSAGAIVISLPGKIAIRLEGIIDPTMVAIVLQALKKTGR